MLHGKRICFLSKLATTAMMAGVLCFAVASCATTGPTQTNAKTEQTKADLAKALGCPTWANKKDARGGASASQACILAALDQQTVINKSLAGVNSTMGLATRAASSASAIAAAGRVSEAASAVAP